MESVIREVLKVSITGWITSSDTRRGPDVPIHDPTSFSDPFDILAVSCLLKGISEKDNADVDNYFYLDHFEKRLVTRGAFTIK